MKRTIGIILGLAAAASVFAAGAVTNTAQWNVPWGDRWRLRAEETLEAYETQININAAGSAIPLASNKVFIGNAAGTANAKSISGDIEITTGGVVSITALAITNDDIAASAGIAATKIAGTALTQSTTFTGDVNGAWNALAITADSIVDADVNSSAAIAASKISGTALTQSTVFTGDVAGAYGALAIVPGTIVTADLATAEAASLALADTAAQKADVFGAPVIASEYSAGVLISTNVITLKNGAGDTTTDYAVARVWLATAANAVTHDGTEIEKVVDKKDYWVVVTNAGTVTFVITEAATTTNLLSVSVGPNIATQTIPLSD